MLRVAPLRLTADACRQILDAASRAEPREACGLAAGSVVVELPNRASGGHHFEVPAADVAAAVEALGTWGDVTAVWHSHPVAASSPFPSATDEAYHPVGKIMIIAHRGELTAYAEDTGP